MKWLNVRNNVWPYKKIKNLKRNVTEESALKSQVNNGKITAVLIDNEATLKRVYIYEDKVVLQPENTKYPPFVYTKEDMNNIRILGKAVGFTSLLN